MQTFALQIFAPFALPTRDNWLRLSVMGATSGERSVLLSLNIAKIGQISQNNDEYRKLVKTPLGTDAAFKMQTFAFQDFRAR